MSWYNNTRRTTVRSSVNFHDYTFVKSRLWNSCAKCNEWQIHVSTEEEPWRSYCHDFQCRRRITEATEGAGVEVADPNLVNQDLTETTVQMISPSDTYIHTLGQELLACVFDFLDLYSLCRAGDVCTRWRDLVQSRTYEKKFETALDKFLPYPLRQLYPVMDHKVISHLFYSVNCYSCLLRDRDLTTDSERYPSRTEKSVRRITKELKEFPCEGNHVVPVKDGVDKLIARIEGPKDSPFENGIFYLIITYPEISTFPFTPPTCRFLTKVFHPAISCHGHISVDLLHENWSPSQTIQKIIVSLQSLLTDSHLELCEQTPIGKLFKENRAEYERIARIWTQKFAMQHLIYPTCAPE